MENPQIERANRDSPELAIKPHHFLIEMLSYQDRRYMLSRQRNL